MKFNDFVKKKENELKREIEDLDELDKITREYRNDKSRLSV